LIIAAALPPIPPDTESGASVLAFDPILTPDRALDVKTILPEPFAANVKLLFAPLVVISGVLPPARVRTPVGDIDAFVGLKKLIFPWVPLAVETSVNVPPEVLPPLIVGLLPSVKVVVEGSDNEALLVSVVRLDAVIVVPLSVKLPAVVSTLLLLKKLILPVEPSVSVWLLVVPSTPAPVRKVALLPFAAEMEAVGIPPALFKKPNFAEAVAVPPSRTSTVET